jgi:undecaprenyl-phosphate 4-deoxy-4-formamido-L-arabinose transferase
MDERAGTASGISIVVPAYNSHGSLPELVIRLRKLFAGFLPFEIIIVNDGSSDGSWLVIERLSAEYPEIQGIDLMRNYGQHNALLAGVRAAHHDVIVTIDDDLQHPPEEVPKLVAKLAEGYDVVYGTPERAEHELWRNVASRVTKLALQSTMGASTARNVSAFRAFRTHLRDAFANYQSSFVSIDVLLTWGTKRFGAVAVRHEPRRIGSSNYTLSKLVIHSLNMMTGFSTWPLQLASLLGFGSTLFGLAVLVYVVGRYLLQGTSVPGFPFLASIIAVFAGVQMFALGIIGEYLARMHFRMMERPTYAVRGTCSPMADKWDEARPV